MIVPILDALVMANFAFLVYDIHMCNSFSSLPASLGIPELGYIFSITSMGVGSPGIRFRGVFCTGAAATTEVSEIAARMAVSFIVPFVLVLLLCQLLYVTLEMTCIPTRVIGIFTG
jgi:hypothetical protein